MYAWGYEGPSPNHPYHSDPWQMWQSQRSCLHDHFWEVRTSACKHRSVFWVGRIIGFGLTASGFGQSSVPPGGIRARRRERLGPGASVRPNGVTWLGLAMLGYEIRAVRLPCFFLNDTALDVLFWMELMVYLWSLVVKLFISHDMHGCMVLMQSSSPCSHQIMTHPRSDPREHLLDPIGLYLH